ncbi:MAG TPA: TIGR02300 family protein [Stellaceae bacterium]|nr:TIGR02300 family protein [Stellaceae bacterium]
MAKAEWGTKRLCPNCGTRYYDMRHDPIVCPRCGAAFDPEALLKTRRTRAAAPAVVEPVAEEEIEPDLGGEEVPAPEEAEAAIPIETGEEEEEEEGEEGEDEEEEVLEDASELGEDEDDMAEVIENVDDEDE